MDVIHGKIGERWVWVMDIIFGGIATLAFKNLVLALSAVNIDVFWSLILVLFGAISVFIFFLYDVTVVHYLYNFYPYNFSWLSGFRLITDLIMAFLLALIVIPVMSLSPEKATVNLLISISIWHLFALLWHYLAVKEKDNTLQLPNNTLYHFIPPVAYWVIALLVLKVQNNPISLAEINQPIIFILVCLAIIISSFFRTIILVKNLAKKR